MEYLLRNDIMFFVVSSILSAIVIRAMFTKLWAKAQFPPSPLALPIIGHLHLLGALPHRALLKLSYLYGPMFHLYLGSIPYVVVSTPETAKECFKTHESSFLNRPQPNAMNIISYPKAYFVLSNYGPRWKFMKKIWMNRLLGAQTLDQLAPIRREELKSFVHSIWRRAGARETVNFRDEVSKLSNNIISRMVMSRRCSEDEDEAEELRNAVNESTEIIGKFNLSDFIWWLKKLDLQRVEKRGKMIHEKFDKMVEAIIEEHQEKRKNNGDVDDHVKDLVDILLEVSEDDDSEIKLTRDNIKAFVLDAFIAGTDTAAITMEWAMSLLINNPDIINKARQEIDSTVGKTRLVEESDIVNLPYIQAIVKETLRLYPPAPLIGREASKNCTINGFNIPEKTRLLVNVWAIGRDPNHWEDPHEFRPERFLVEQGQNYQFLPFGSGRRSCPGAALGKHIVQTSVATMIQCFDWKADGKDGIVDMEEAPGLTLPRAHPLICSPVSRLSSLPI